METNAKNLANAYKAMESLPEQLNSLFQYFGTKDAEEKTRHERAIQTEVQVFQKKKDSLATQKNDAYSAADFARKEIVSKVENLQERLKDRRSDYINACYALTKSDTPKLPKVLAEVFNKISAEKEDAEMTFNKSAEKILAQENTIYLEKIADADHSHDSQLATESEKYSHAIDYENQRHETNKNKLLEEMKQKIMSMRPEYLKDMYDKLRLNSPAIMNYETATVIPEAVELGFIRYDLNRWNSPNYIPLMNLIRSYFSFALGSETNVLLLPCGQSFQDPRINKIIVYDPITDRDIALDYLRAIEMRLFMSIPCGKLQVTMIDPVDSGSNFSMFSCLGDDDERIISTRIWCDPKRIKERLNLLISQIEHVNQDCLRNDFTDIVAYNEHVGKNAEPLQALFVADFPRHFDQESCELLEKIVSSGPRCGIYTFIVGRKQDIDNSRNNFDGIFQSMQYYQVKNQRIYYKYGNNELPMDPITLPSKEQQPEIFEALINGIKTSDRIIIYFDEIADELTKHPEKWFMFDDANGIDVPIGLEGASRTVQIHLGGELITQHHALISGTIGSGKSTLLHTIVMSILLRYSPEDVQIYLLDFKRGVEFKTYADSNLPNFRVISLDTEPEFGLAVLQYLEQEQAERAQEFHDKGCDDIERYNEIVKENPSGDIIKIPRIIVIIDEFHEMFSKSDSQITKECERLLEQVVRQGRAMGIHVILASQTLPDNLVKIYGQIMNRVALQSTASSAQYILDSDNEVVNSLVNVDPGKGVFNDGGGNKDANHPFRVAYFNEDEQRELLEKIKKQQQIAMRDGIFGDVEFEKPRLLLSSIQDDSDNPLNRFVVSGELPRRLDFGCPLYLGEEISMINDFSVQLTSRRAQNLLIMGSDTNRASILYGFSAMSILFNALRKSDAGRLSEKPIITFFDFGNNSSFRRSSKSKIDIMNELSARFPHAIRVFGKESLMDGLSILQNEYEHRSEDQSNHYVIFAGLNRARRLLDNDSAYAMPPKKIFENLVKKGPENGYNFIIWANEPSSFCSFYGDILSEFDYRLVYDLKEEEYELVVKSTAMDTAYGNNVISYNPDEDNKKVRIYSMPLTGWFKKFMDRIDGLNEDNELIDEGEFGDDY